MRFQEIITERIQLTQYVDRIYNILDRIAEKYDQTQAGRAAIDEVERELGNEIRDIIGSKYYKYSNWVKDVTFTIDPNFNLSAGAYASELKIVMPERPFRDMFDERYKYANGMVNNDDNYQAMLKYISSTVIHEMVHVVQHLLQYAIGRKKTAYKTYAGRTRDFHDEIRQGKYSKLYYSSPQEIEAHAHEAAIYVIKKLSSNRDFSDIRKLIIDRLKMGIPEFDQLDQPVINRYIKKTYQEIQSELEKRNKKPVDKKHRVLTHVIRELGHEALDQYSAMIEMNVREYIKQNPNVSQDDLDVEFEERLNEFEAVAVVELVSDIRKALKEYRVPVNAIRRITANEISLLDEYNELVRYELSMFYILAEINDDRQVAIDQLSKALTNIGKADLERDFASHITSLLDDDNYDRMQKIDKIFASMQPPT